MCETLKNLLFAELSLHLSHSNSQSYFGIVNRIIDLTAQSLRNCQASELLDVSGTFNFLNRFYEVLRGVRKKDTHFRIRRFFLRNSDNSKKRRNLFGIMKMAVKIHL